MELLGVGFGKFTDTKMIRLAVSCCNEKENKEYGGEGGIRTHGARKGSTVFETARFNRSRTSPLFFHYTSWGYANSVCVVVDPVAVLADRFEVIVGWGCPVA